MNPRVNVLLATFNGETFLREQLKSFDDQTLPVTCFTVRDDGSTDATPSLLSSWAESHNNVRYLSGPRLGPGKSFFALLDQSDDDCQFFSFSDQDDVWLPHKIERAVAMLQSRAAPDDPAMYACRVEFVDRNLQHLAFSKFPKRLAFANALVENVAAGCTIVLNRAARDLVRECQPQLNILHDWWSYLALSAFGRIVYDDKPGIKYRQHGNNTVGSGSTTWGMFKRRATKFFRDSPRARLVSSQALEFQRCFGGRLKPQDRDTLNRFLAVRGSLSDRFSYTTAMNVWRQSWPENIVLRAYILLGRV